MTVARFAVKLPCIYLVLEKLLLLMLLPVLIFIFDFFVSGLEPTLPPPSAESQPLFAAAAAAATPTDDDVDPRSRRRGEDDSVELGEVPESPFTLILDELLTANFWCDMGLTSGEVYPCTVDFPLTTLLCEAVGLTEAFTLCLRALPTKPVARAMSILLGEDSAKFRVCAGCMLA